MLFNATFNNISAISWRSVLLVDETREPWENHWPVASHWQILSYNVVASTPKHFDDVSFNELFVGITFVNHKIRFQDMCTNIGHSFWWSKAYLICLILVCL
jgi:hypothetical protein